MIEEMDNLVSYSPLTKTFTFNAYLVSGFTPISKGSKLDYDINRPEGMKGYLLNLTTKGEGRIKAGDRYFHCKEGDLLLFPPGVSHQYGRAEYSKFWDHLWVYFIPRPHWIEWLRWDDTNHDIGKTFCEDTELLKHLKTLFYKVLQYNSDTEILSESYAMNALELLVLHCFKIQTISNRQEIDPRIDNICRYLNDNIAINISIEELANRVFLSPSRLAHLFRREMNETISSWREKQRINQARNLIQNSKLSISSIARIIGYNDSVYFSRVFRRHNDITPKEYRKHYEQLRCIKHE